jgi:hypothetical protein
MDDPKVLRTRAKLWRSSAPYHDTAIARAMEAKAQLFEVQAERLDRLRRVLPQSPDTHAVTPPDWP